MLFNKRLSSLLLLVVYLYGCPWAAASQTTGNEPILVKVGVYQNPPLVSISDKQEPQGFFIELLKQVADKHGWQLHFSSGTWHEKLEELEAGRIDILPTIAKTPQRAEKYLFTDQSVIFNWGQIFVPDDSTIRSVLDLNGQRIAALQGDVYLEGQEGLNHLCRNFQVQCELIELDSYSAVLQAVAQGQAEAGLVNRIHGATHARSLGLAASPIVVMPLDIRFAISRNSNHLQILKDVIDTELAAQKADPHSLYHQIFTQPVEHRDHRHVGTYLGATVAGHLRYRLDTTADRHRDFALACPGPHHGTRNQRESFQGTLRGNDRVSAGGRPQRGTANAG